MTLAIETEKLSDDPDVAEAAFDDAFNGRSTPAAHHHTIALRKIINEPMTTIYLPIKPRKFIYVSRFQRRRGFTSTKWT